MPQKFTSLCDAIRAYTDDSGGDGACWTWRAALNQSGYGVVRWRGVQYRAHRAAWVCEYGDIPHDLCVCHRCDNRACVNPSHLFLGTRADNLEDMTRKGRRAVVPRKISVDQVVEIRDKYRRGGFTQSALGRQYGIGQTQVGRIVRGERWRHVSHAR